MGLFGSILKGISGVASAIPGVGPIASAALGAVGDIGSQMQSQDNTASANAASIDMYKHKHQWEVADLRKAGLNPILSAGGSGSSMPSTPVASTAEHSSVRETMQNKLSTQILADQAREQKAKADSAEDEYRIMYGHQQVPPANAEDYMRLSKFLPSRREREADAQLSRTGASTALDTKRLSEIDSRISWMRAQKAGTIQNTANAMQQWLITQPKVDLYALAQSYGINPVAGESIAQLVGRIVEYKLKGLKIPKR
jgi:hypothetical protein